MQTSGDRDIGGKRLLSRAARHNFGFNVRRIRTSLGWSTITLAEKIGIHQTKLSQIELGHVNATLGTIARIAYALHVSIAALVEERLEN